MFTASSSSSESDSSRGPTTCGGRPGSQDHTAADAATYIAAGVDYVKLDNCNANPADDVRRTQFSAMGTALAGKTIPLSIYPYPAGVDIETFQQWMSTVGQVYRNAGSMSDTFASVVSNVDSNADGVAYTRGGSWNDAGLLEVGNGGMTDVEYRSQMSLWAIMASPLIVGNDLTKATPATLDILSNREVIAVNQDPLALSGFRVGTGGAYGGGLEVWSKPLSDCGARAVALFNRNNAAADIAVTWAQIGLAPGAATVRDLWAKADLGSSNDMYSVHVPAHGTALAEDRGHRSGSAIGRQDAQRFALDLRRQQRGARRARSQQQRANRQGWHASFHQRQALRQGARRACRVARDVPLGRRVHVIHLRRRGRRRSGRAKARWCSKFGRTEPSSSTAAS